MKLSVVIPAYNEEKTIAKILKKVFLQPEVKNVLVVNDGSFDKTHEVLENISLKIPPAKRKRLKIFKHASNMGKGSALKTAFNKVSGDFVIVQDADLEYNPREYKKLLKTADKDTVVYGSRILGNNPHAYTRTYLGNMLITFFNNLLFGSRLTDIYTCYKLIPKKIVRGLKLSSRGFEVEAEITAKLLKNGIKILEVPISYRPRSYSQGKKIKAIDAARGAWVLFKVWLGL